MYNTTDNELDKQLLNVLNQHGLDAMLSIVHDEIERAYAYGFDIGKDDGWCECYETYQESIEDDYEDNYYGMD